MISEKDLEQEYIKNNIDIIMKNIKENNYDYNGKYHDELKETLEYLISINDDFMISEYCDHVKNIVLDDNKINKILFSSYIAKLASSMDKKTREKVENLTIKKNFAEYIYKFARDVKGINIEKLEEAIIATKDARYICEFARNVKGANIGKLEDAVIAIENADYILYFARHVKGANIEKLEEAIIATKNAEYIFYFALEIKNANIEKLEDAVIATKNAEYIYCFALEIENANIEKLEDAIIATKNVNFIFCFAKNVTLANVEKLEDAIIATKNVFYIYLFGETVIDAKINKLMTAINETDNLELIAAFAYIPKSIRKYPNSKFSYMVFEHLEKMENEVFSSIIKSKNIGRCIFNQSLSEEIKQQFIDYLFNNIDEGNNPIILRIYLNMLKNPNIKEEDVDALDLEYKNYIMQNNKENNQGNVLKLKRFTDKKK